MKKKKLKESVKELGGPNIIFGLSREKRRKLSSYRTEIERYQRLSDEDKYFEANMTGLYHNNSLGYNGYDYKAVVFRYPVGEDTTVEEVNQYFNELINLLQKEKIDEKSTRKLRDDDDDAR